MHNPVVLLSTWLSAVSLGVNLLAVVVQSRRQAQVLAGRQAAPRAS